jgi:hypothetical protein
MSRDRADANVSRYNEMQGILDRLGSIRRLVATFQVQRLQPLAHGPICIASNVALRYSFESSTWEIS